VVRAAGSAAGLAVGSAAAQAAAEHMACEVFAHGVAHGQSMPNVAIQCGTETGYAMAIGPKHVSPFGSGSADVFIFIPGSGSKVGASGVLDEDIKEAANGTLTKLHCSHMWVVIDGTHETGRCGWKKPCPKWLHMLVESLARHTKARGGRVSLVGFSRGSWWASDLIAAGSISLARALLVAPYFCTNVSPKLTPEAVVQGARNARCELAVVASMTDSANPWITHGTSVMILVSYASWAAVYSTASHERAREVFLVGSSSDPEASTATLNYLYDDGKVINPKGTTTLGVHWYKSGVHENVSMGRAASGDGSMARP